jgi:antitoxin component YwqK of YwqJK toxin-antitoxin module
MLTILNILKNTIDKKVYLLFGLITLVLCNHTIEVDEKFENGQSSVKFTAYKNNAGELIKDGKSIWFYNNGGKKLECIYQNGVLAGKSTSWYENGNKKGESIYKNGFKCGRSISWYENGTIKQITPYDNEKIDGIDSCWYPNGQIHWVVNYRSGILEGQFIRWYENGQMEMIGTSIDTIYDGKITGWFSNGKKMVEFISHDRKIDSTSISRWDSLGKPTMVHGRKVM